jgi:hypothetical protein
MPRITTRDHQRGHKRAEQAARQLAGKTFDQMAGELTA